jgi:AraC-like DNA-binding protein
LLHTELARPWTADELARQVFLSRSTFADRFSALIGMPPMTYLTRWRMHVAAQRLSESRRSVAQISAEVGYESEIAFAKAFKRQFSMSPAQWRKERLL